MIKSDSGGPWPPEMPTLGRWEAVGVSFSYGAAC